MSVQIILTDPTDDEARRIADYLMALTGHAPINFDASVLVAHPKAVAENIASSNALVTPPAPTVPPADQVFMQLTEGMRPTAACTSTPVAPTVIVVPVEAPRQHRHDDSPAAPTPRGVELDSAGLPWDGRIHSDTKSKIGDGTWRIRRGSDPAVVAAITAELKAAMRAPVPAPTPPAAVPVPPPFVLSAAPSVPPVPTIPVTGSAGAAPTASPSSVAVPPVAIAITTFPQLMMAITKGIGKGTFTQPDVVKAIEGVGLASIPMLASRPDLIPAVAAALGV